MEAFNGSIAHRTATHAGTVTAVLAIDPDDLTDLPEVTQAIYVAIGNDLAINMVGGGSFSFTGVNAGTVLPIRVARIKQSGTTAAGLVGLH